MSAPSRHEGHQRRWHLGPAVDTAVRAILRRIRIRPATVRPRWLEFIYGEKCAFYPDAWLSWESSRRVCCTDR